MKREELKPMSDLFLDMGVDVEGNRNYQPWTAYDKDEADSVMDAMENDNADLRHNLEDWKCENEALKQQIRILENDKEEMYEANLVQQARIKELEEKLAMKLDPALHPTCADCDKCVKEK